VPERVRQFAMVQDAFVCSPVSSAFPAFND
jgi:hypothetical protein